MCQNCEGWVVVQNSTSGGIPAMLRQWHLLLAALHRPSQAQVIVTSVIHSIVFRQPEAHDWDSYTPSAHKPHIAVMLRMCHPQPCADDTPQLRSGRDCAPSMQQTTQKGPSSRRRNSRLSTEPLRTHGALALAGFGLTVLGFGGLTPGAFESPSSNCSQVTLRSLRAVASDIQL